MFSAMVAEKEEDLCEDKEGQKICYLEGGLVEEYQITNMVRSGLLRPIGRSEGLVPSSQSVQAALAPS